MGEDDDGVAAATVGEIDGGVGAAVVDKHAGSGQGWGRDRGRGRRMRCGCGGTERWRERRRGAGWDLHKAVTGGCGVVEAAVRREGGEGEGGRAPLPVMGS